MPAQRADPAVPAGGRPSSEAVSPAVEQAGPEAREAPERPEEQADPAEPSIREPWAAPPPVERAVAAVAAVTDSRAARDRRARPAVRVELADGSAESVAPEVRAAAVAPADRARPAATAELEARRAGTTPPTTGGRTWERRVPVVREASAARAGRAPVAVPAARAAPEEPSSADPARMDHPAQQVRRAVPAPMVPPVRPAHRTSE
ncbi:hypothetical protein [Tsukamurella sp. NPDC003166]|uniref:hypothetical protein n=1 Tax=Tsukamurella sp. NPDC003166 TaxID=3154444 RepID=UPI0033AA4F55